MAKKNSKKEPKAADNKRNLDPEHLEWLIKNRSDTQKTSARLYRLIQENPEEVIALQIPVPTFVSISFSLWRSVFYSDKTGLAKDTNIGAMGILSEMLENNAIGYSNEWRARDWTFNYYAQNARSRLMELKNWRGIKFPSVPAAYQAAPKKRWEAMQDAFEAAVEQVDKLIRAEKSRRRKPKKE
jgi:hypothetical protein